MCLPVFFEKYDVWQTPVSIAPAFKHQKPGIPFETNGWKVPYTKAFIPFNFPSTIPGNPIVVIPIGVTKKKTFGRGVDSWTKMARL